MRAGKMGSFVEALLPPKAVYALARLEHLSDTKHLLRAFVDIARTSGSLVNGFASVEDLVLLAAQCSLDDADKYLARKTLRTYTMPALESTDACRN